MQNNLLEMVNCRIEVDFRKAAQSVVAELIATQRFCHKILSLVSKSFFLFQLAFAFAFLH
jgi:hypothetical protein